MQKLLSMLLEPVGQAAIIAVTLIGVLIISLVGKSAAPLAGAGVAFILLLRLGQISSIIVEAFGAKVAVTRAEQVTKEAEEATKEAEEAAAKVDRAIAALQKVVVHQAVTSLAETFLVHMNQPFDAISIAVEKRKSLVMQLDEFDVSSSEAEMSLHDVDTLFLTHLVHAAVKALELLPEEARLMRQQANHILGMGMRDTAELRKLFETQEPNIKAEGWLKATDEFISTRTIDLNKLQSIIWADGRSS